MHDQVGISADRRREVTVVGRREGVVPAALLGVEGLALGAQEEIVQEALLRLPFDLLEQPLEGRRRDLGQVSLELVAEALEDFLQVDEAVRVGAVVDPVDRRLLGEEELLRHGLVGREHELLDQPVRDVARLGNDPDDQALVVQDDVRVRQVEIDRAPRLRGARAGGPRPPP